MASTRKVVTKPHSTRELELLGKIIRKGRELKEWSQVTLAQAIGLSPSAIAKAELGQRRLRRENLVCVAHILDLDLKQLMEAAGYCGECCENNVIVGRIVVRCPAIRTELIRSEPYGEDCVKGVRAEVRATLIDPPLAGHSRIGYARIDFSIEEERLLLEAMCSGAKGMLLDGKPILSDERDRLRVLEKLNSFKLMAEAECVNLAEAAAIEKLKELSEQ